MSDSTEDKYIIRLRTKVSTEPVGDLELSNREIVFGNYEKMLCVKDYSGTLHYFFPVDDSITTSRRTWSSYKIKSYVDASVAGGGCDLTNYYTKDEINDILLTKANAIHVHTTNEIVNDSDVPGTTLNDALDYLEALAQSGSSGTDITVIVTNTSGSLISKGQPIRLTTTSNGVGAAIATSLSDGHVVGVAMEDISAGSSGNAIQVGTINASSEEWGNIIIGGGTLQVGSSYFLSAEGLGKIDTNPPTQQGYVNVLIGQAITTTKLMLNISTPILL